VLPSAEPGVSTSLPSLWLAAGACSGWSRS